MILDKILASKRTEAKAWCSAQRSRFEQSASARAPRDFFGALSRDGMSMIAEVKMRAPSAGAFSQATAPISLARQYQENGARAISVVADPEFFGGSSELVQSVANDSQNTLPILFKDFIVCEEQIYLARACGADGVLLIARAVELPVLSQFVRLVQDLGMEAVVETFDEGDICNALQTSTRVIGINNHDPETARIDLCRSERLVALLPGDVVKLSASGIRSRSDIILLERRGFDAVLVGEALLRAVDPGVQVGRMLGRIPESSEGLDNSIQTSKSEP